MIQTLSKNLPAYSKNNHSLKVAIVKSNYHPDLTESLEKACRKYLIACGVKIDNLQTFDVPGSWEIPLIVKNITLTKKYDGIIAFGIIIKGETYHFELIANECARTLMNIAVESNTPVIFEVLATYNLEQAKKRSVGRNNKGVEAAKSLLEIIKVLSGLRRL